MYSITKSGYDPKRVSLDGTTFLLQNGSLSLRGTLEEHQAKDSAACNLFGLLDSDEEGRKRAVTTHHPLTAFFEYRGNKIGVDTLPPYLHESSLDMKTGTFSRKTTFHLEDALMTVESERFLDQTHRSMIYAQYQFSASSDIDIDFYTGIDTLLLDEARFHLSEVTHGVDNEILWTKSKTKDTKKEILVAQGIWTNFRNKETLAYLEDKILHHYQLKLTAARVYTVHIFATVMHSQPSIKKKALDRVASAKTNGYRKLATANKRWWAKKWLEGGVDITGLEEIDTGIKHSLFQLIGIRPQTDTSMVPSSPLWNGLNLESDAWKTDLFVFPYYLNTDLKSAKRYLKSRFHGLPKAIEEAKKRGYRGALYLDDDAFELNDSAIPIHGNTALAFALKDYLSRTLDAEILLEGGLDFLYESALFYTSYAKFDATKKRYVFQQVLGVDLSFPPTDHDGYTHHMVLRTLETFFQTLTMARKIDHDWVHAFEQERVHEIQEIRQVKNTIALPPLDVQSQKAGDLLLRVLTTQRASPYLPNKKKPLTHLMALLGQSMQAIEENHEDDAIPLFLQLAQCGILKPIDAPLIAMTSTQYVMHGMAYWMLMQGFCDLRAEEYLLSADYRLPKGINGISTKVWHRGKVAQVKVRNHSVLVSWNEEEPSLETMDELNSSE
ncbi:MAG: hypothetical protein PHP32_01125 [Candidatus Izemoplasmatales bacterium]|nr:hypothetical protein [Candidatus Izemoplasmatales bacterium]